MADASEKQGLSVQTMTKELLAARDDGAKALALQIEDTLKMYATSSALIDRIRELTNPYTKPQSQESTPKQL